MMRKVLATSLVVAPVLFAATETTRLAVEHGTTGPADGLAAIRDSRSAWELFGWLVLVTAPVWLAATLGLVEALRARRGRWATAAGLVAVCGALGWAMHQTAYAEVNALAAAQLAGHPDVALAVYAGEGGTGLEDATIVAMAGGLLLGVLALTLGLTRAGLLPWWAFACVPAWVVVMGMSGGASPVLALGNLVLLPPFVLTARTLASAAATSDAPTGDGATRIPAARRAGSVSPA